ncbi:MAG: hypothetical protein HON29_04720 [Candidatus Magasanikbacteria bacterium]|nr:hypothetical protein [Candidatus Magasanikbacteria bacterium]
MRYKLLSKKLHFFVLLLLLWCVVPTLQLQSAMDGGDYVLYADDVGLITSGPGTGGSFELFSSAGDFGGQNIEGGAVMLRGGFEAMTRGTVALSLSSTTLALGELSSASVATGSIVATITSEEGYDMSIAEDGDLRDGAKTIDDVADGAVTAGSEEYGIKATDGDGVLSQDTAITNNLVVASNVGYVRDKETTVTFSASIDPTQTQQGSYAHTVTLTLTAKP